MHIGRIRLQSDSFGDFPDRTGRRETVDVRTEEGFYAPTLLVFDVERSVERSGKIPEPYAPEILRILTSRVLVIGAIVVVVGQYIFVIVFKTCYLQQCQ